MRIKLTSDYPIDSFILEDLYGYEYIIKNNEDNILERAWCRHAWYLLRVPYAGQKIEIENIFVDGYELNQFKYTGYFETESGTKYQPATAVWEPGEFKIWIHTSIGHLKGELITQIANGDFGKNLFNDYILTVDKPITLPDKFPKDIQSFYSYGTGPKWWHKSKSPYVELDIEKFKTMYNEMPMLENLCKIDIPLSKNHKGWSYKSWDGAQIGSANLNNYNLESYAGFGKYFKQIGFKKLFQVNFGYLSSMGYINMHKDDHTTSKNRKNIIGNKKFYWSYENADADYFKMAGVGILPTHNPILVDVCAFTHSVVNISKTKTRKSLQVTGIF